MKLGQGNIFRNVCQEFCPRGGGACVAGCVCGGGYAWQGVYMAWGTCVAGGHAWQGGVCGGDVHGRGACMPRMPPGHHKIPSVNARAVRILLECILVEHVIRIGTTCFDTDFVSQMKLTTKPLINCFVYASAVAV